MKSKFKLAILVVIVLVVIIVGVIVSNKRKSSKSEETKLIKVNEVTRSVFYAPQYVAINNGFFKENGLELELTTGQRSRNTPSLLTTFPKNGENAENQVKIENYYATYEDIADVFSKIKNKGILKETIILNGQAQYKTGKITLQKREKNTKRKSKKHIKKEEEFEL